MAECVNPTITPSLNFSDAQVDGQKYHYNSATSNQYDVGGFCQAAGGTWNGFNGNPQCAGLSSNFYQGSPLIVNSESQAVSVADAAVPIIAPACTVSLLSDSGWGAPGNGIDPGTFPATQNGIIVQDHRVRLYTLGGTCSTTKEVDFLRVRQVICPFGYATRTNSTGSWDCFIPARAPCPWCGNPVSPVYGAKLQDEVDYRPATAGGLEVRRSYNSASVFRAPGATVTPQTSNDYWRFSYQRTLYQVTGLTGVSAILQREDGELIYFDSSGNEILNRAGAAERLATISGGWTVTRANSDVETYDSTGRLTRITTRAGLVTTVSYSSGAYTVTDDFGAQLVFSVDASNRVTQVALPSQATVTYGYDAIGRLTKVTYPDMTSKTYWYEDTTNGWLLTGITDESAVRFATYTYQQGRVATETHAGVDNYQFQYYTALGSSQSGITTSVTDPLGNVRWFYFLDANGVMKLQEVSGCPTCGLPSWATYDANGNPLTSLDQKRNTTTFVYDPVRNLETSRTEGLDSSGSVTPRTRTITTSWHATFRQPLSISVYSGGTATGTPLRTTSFTYDGSGNALTKTVTDTTVVPNVARTWTYTYDGVGHVLTAVGPRTDVVDKTTYAYYTCSTGYQCGQLQTITNALSQVTTFNTYNAFGQPLTITDPNGVVTTLGYDGRQRLTSRQVGTETTAFDYWPTGLLKKVTLPDSSYLLYTYDNAHRLTQVNDGLNNKIVYTLDGNGNRTGETTYDPSNVLSLTHTRVFNALNQLYQDIGAANTGAVTTTYGYDSNSNQTSIAAPLSRNTALTYDELDRLNQVTDPGSGVTHYAYDANDNLVQVTDPRTLVTTYQYTGFGDVKQLTSPDTGVTSNSYDSGGNLATSTDARNAISSYTYDALNRVATAAFKIGSTTDQTITYSYDAGTNGKGRLTGASDANHSMTWTYDTHGRVASKVQTLGSVNLTVSYIYTNGNLTTLTTPSGQIVTYSYSNGQVSSITINSTTLLSSVAYEPLGPARGWTWGNGTTEVRLHNTDGNPSQISAIESSTYGYDNAFRITGITNTSNSALSWTYGYDLLDRLTSAVETSQTLGWTFDADSNRLTQTGTIAGTYTPATNSNRLNTISGTPARSYTYDPAGNTLTYSNITFTYNDRGRMQTAQVGSSTTSYVYNALGQRIKKSGGSAGTVLVVYDEAGHILGEYTSSGGLTQETVWLGDTPVATIVSGKHGVATYYVHADHLNAPRMITQPADNKIAWRWDTDPFGTAAPNQNPQNLGTFVFNLRYPGQYFDSETGIFNNYFRDYDPQTGRYVESDLVGLDAGVNTYTYVQNGPLGAADPLGLVTRGGGWTNPQWAAIKQAERAIRDELKKGCSCAKGGGTSCIPCEVRMRLLDRLQNSEVEQAPLGGDCGLAGLGYRLYLSPAAFTKRCDCAASTLYHELLHNAGLDHDATPSGPGIEDLEQRCVGNLCKKAVK